VIRRSQFPFFGRTMNKQTPIAVVGMAGIFPDAPDLDTFWNNIVNKVGSSVEVPESRWPCRTDAVVSPVPMPDKAFSKKACLIHDFSFDPVGFDLDPAFLSSLDPMYHILLHAGKAALQSCDVSDVKRDRIGTILAAIVLPTDGSSHIARKLLESSLKERILRNGAVDCGQKITLAEAMAAKVTGLPAAVLARGLGLGAGSYTLDAACASSLFAVKLACDELQADRADAMLAGGVSRPDCLYTQVGFSQLRALSPSGRCAPFDAKADGLVVGEGAGILVLKRLDDAQHAGDRILGVIRGIGLSNDMRGNLLAPDSEGQVRAMHQAYRTADWRPQNLDYIECHGAGTPVGDAVELNSLRTLWGETGWKKARCSIGSVKSMIGHLLTAAGAAGMIKTLLALHNKILPPSLNFTRAPADSPLIDGPFRVQTDPAPWEKRAPAVPRRAAVSAFGFGGINAHLLFEEWNPETSGEKYRPAATKRIKPEFDPAASESAVPVAVIGMDAFFGALHSLHDFQHAVFKGESAIRKRPDDRWKGLDDLGERLLEGRAVDGGYIDQVTVNIGDFHIPPKEIPDMLPQHLLMLKVALGAMKDAGISQRQERPRMGAFIGLDFDFEATNFHLRWSLQNLSGMWRRRMEKSPAGEFLGGPLTRPRTLGALGGIIASRIAREFRFGGPSFGVSGGEISGLKALEIAVRSLQQFETDTVLVGAVDLCGDIRHVLTADTVTPFSKTGRVRPFDSRADGCLPGEGAAAVILKRLDDALRDCDRIYAVVRGVGSAGGGGIDRPIPSKEAYIRSLTGAFTEAGIESETVSYVEMHGSGDRSEDELETLAIHDFFGMRKEACAVGTVKPIIGRCGAAAGLASFVKTCLCLYQEIIPPVVNYIRSSDRIWDRDTFHIPAFAQYWSRDRIAGPRRACTAAMTADGNCMHVVVEEFEAPGEHSLYPMEKYNRERKQPAGPPPCGLFVVEGDGPQALISGLDALGRQMLPGEWTPRNIDDAARRWFDARKMDRSKRHAVAIVADSSGALAKGIESAKSAVAGNELKQAGGPFSLSYSSEPLFPSGKLAFVFPGAGNHYVGMGRQTGVLWPEILRRMDRQTDTLKSQLSSRHYVPHRNSWETGWEHEAHDRIAADPVHLIVGQVTYGCLVYDLLKEFRLLPDAVLGYSLGESAALFGTGAWPDRGIMLERMRATNLFRTELAGPCHAARRAWNIPSNEEVNWSVAVINRSPETVSRIVKNWPTTRLLIINTPEECVVGGRKPHVDALIEALGCNSVFLEGIVTVHCDAVLPVQEPYRRLHLFPTSPPPGIRFYSCARAFSYRPTSKGAAASILRQAISGFNFPALIEQTYRDGIRIFLEIGPHSSCSRMVADILGNRPHLAVPVCSRGESECFSILSCLGALIAERVPVNLNFLYDNAAGRAADAVGVQSELSEKATLCPGEKKFDIDGLYKAMFEAESGFFKRGPLPGMTTGISKEKKNASPPDQNRPHHPHTILSYSDLIAGMTECTGATSKAHRQFLSFSEELAEAFGRAFTLHGRILELGSLKPGSRNPALHSDEVSDVASRLPRTPVSSGSGESVAFSREQCLEFAVGSLATLFGPEFQTVDSFKRRVRLPDEPLMLVDRILSIEGIKGSLSSGRIITEHDVRPGAWYLDGGRAPVCISVEAGQADLFLCSYLGIDFAVRGERTYRLLDATVLFHRELPRRGDTIRYEIEIEKFVRQGDIYLFFFHFEGFIGKSHFITMTNGCAGFFTAEEIRRSGGIIWSEEDKKPKKGKTSPGWTCPVAVSETALDDAAVEALRAGDLERAFGPLFTGICLPECLMLPGGRLRLIDRIPLIDPNGGRYGLGIVRAEADIHPDDWFLTCHFMDDMVMPGTLMYECCAHALRVFIQRLGWISDQPRVVYEPVKGVPAVLKCRGPVTPETRQVVYEVEIKEIGYMPEPYVIADAHMYADGKRIVQFQGLSMKMTGTTQEQIENFWRVAGRKSAVEDRRPVPITGRLAESKDVAFPREKILAFAVGNPSDAFGEPYKPFDESRFIARLPGPPYSFIDRIIRVEPAPWDLKPDGWIEAAYDVHPDAWYFRANRTAAMPFCVLLEIGLQACGWLAAYAGSALKSDRDLRFRNLDGKGIQYETVRQGAETLTVRSRLSRVSSTADMIIEQFDLVIFHESRKIYEGKTTFGFFTTEVLARQVGLRDIPTDGCPPDGPGLQQAVSAVFADETPLNPDDPPMDPPPRLAMPARALRMIDAVESFIPNGGPYGLGYIRGVKTVDPEEWFFKAHFYQDPVCPGSLGIESLLQCLKFMAIYRWPEKVDDHVFQPVTGATHKWRYRGQIVPANKKIEVEAIVTRILDRPTPAIYANGLLKVDGLYIYDMQNFGIQLIKADIWGPIAGEGFTPAQNL